MVKRPVLKTGNHVSGLGVRIPPPPAKLKKFDFLFLIYTNKTELDMNNNKNTVFIKRILMTQYKGGKCKKCNNKYSVMMTISEHEKKRPKCPKCGSMSCKQMITTFSVQTSKKS